MHRSEQLLLLLLDILFCGLIEQLNTLLHLLQLLLTNLLDSLRHSSLLRLIVLYFLLELFVHRSQLVLVLTLDGIHFQFNLSYFRHLSKEFLRVDVTEFLSAGNNRQSQQNCNNKFFHFKFMIYNL